MNFVFVFAGSYKNAIFLMIVIFVFAGRDQQHEGDLQMSRRQRILLSGHLLATTLSIPESR